MQPTATSRRDRLRMETTAEIKAVALRLMADGGPEAISLRAIAREMGMTAGAIYSYFATRDDLVTELTADVYNALVEAVETARDKRPADDVAGRLTAWADAFRGWAVDNPEGFRLVYGDPVPGYRAPADSAVTEAERRACAGLTDLVAQAWPDAAKTQSSGNHRWSDFDPQAVTDLRAVYPKLPPAALALTMRIWGRMYGLVSLEVHGHLRTQTREPGKLYRAEIRDLLTSLGLRPRGRRGS